MERDSTIEIADPNSGVYGKLWHLGGCTSIAAAGLQDVLRHTQRRPHPRP